MEFIVFTATNSTRKAGNTPFPGLYIIREVPRIPVLDAPINTLFLSLYPPGKGKITNSEVNRN